MSILFSKAFEVQETELKRLGVFDAVLDGDSHFFINIKLLQNTTVPEFKDGYSKINDFFGEIGSLLSMADEGDKLYKTAYKIFHFPEINGVNLGFASGVHGNGFGEKLRKQIIADAFKIIKAGNMHPEIFHLLGLFEDWVGPDRLSDMFGGILFDNIIAFTKRINRELGITQEHYPQFNFNDDIPINPYKRGEKILLLPEEILHELPIAKDWDDIDRVCSENEAIRAEINDMINETWAKMSMSRKKAFLKQTIFENPQKLERVINAYRDSKAEPFNIFSDTEYLVNYLSSTISFDTNAQQTNSFEASKYILSEYTHWVEYNRGALILCDGSPRKAESAVQRTIHATAKIYCKEHNWDINPEEDQGRGPVDFKISRGNDKTVVEVKLTSNPKCVHGLETQIEEYAQAEQTNNKIFVLVDNGKCSFRIDEVKSKYNEMKALGKNPAHIIMIDAKPKASASKF